MPKGKKKTSDADILPEYDFTGAVRGKYLSRYTASSNVVVLDPDVSEAFPNAETVNDALRVLAKAAKSRITVPGRTARAKKRPNKRMQQTRSAGSPKKTRRPRN